MIHELSDTEYYIGTSVNGLDIYAATWRIKKISNGGDVWLMNKFPNGNQGFTFVWNDRLTYDYE